MATQKQLAAARRNVKKAQAGAKRRKTLKKMGKDELRRAIARAR